MKLNIAFVSNGYPPFKGGGCVVLTKNLLEGLREKGHRLTALIPKNNHIGESRKVFGICTIFELTAPFSHPPPPSPLRKLTVLQRNYLASLRIYKQIKPQIVFILNVGRMSLGPAYAAQHMGIPFVMSLNDLTIHQYAPVECRSSLRKKLRGVFEDLFPALTFKKLNFEHTISISQATRDSLCQLGVPVQNAKVIYQGIPIEHFEFCEKIPFPDGTVHLLFVGNLIAYKGCATLVRALACLKTILPLHRVLLTIVGDGIQRNELEQLVENLGLEGEVLFEGWIQQENLPTWYHRHDIFIFPSECEEAFGLAFLEAMACGTPVVSTATGGNREFLQHKKNCLIFQPGDEKDLAQKIVGLVSDPELYQNLRQVARQQVRSNFALGRYVEQIEEYLLSVVKNGSNKKNVLIN